MNPGALNFVIERGANQNRKARWVCICDCGNQILALGIHLRSEHTKSCGCLGAELAYRRLLVHGERKKGQPWTTEYRTWMGIKSRCYDQSSQDYRLYGGRGIKVCSRWRNSFANFLMDMGRKPSPKHSIDRFPDNNGNYEPGNCRWATPTQQTRNTRRNRCLNFSGETLPMCDWADRLGLNRGTLLSRIRANWSIERALSQPARKFNTSLRPSA